MTAVGRLGDSRSKPAVRGRADDDGIQASFGGDVGAKRVVVVPEAEVAFRGERVVMLGAPGKDGLDLGMRRSVDLHPQPRRR
jgi:hypothetical protein